MLHGPAQTAQARLAALAARRVAAAGKSGSMPASLRRRLHEEIRRRADAGNAAGVPEPVPRSALSEAWSRWRAVVALTAVGLGATAVLVWVVRSGIQGQRTPSGSLAAATTRTEAFGGAGARGEGTTGEGPAGAVVAEGAANPPPPAAMAVTVTATADAPAGTTGTAEIADAGIRGPSGVVRLRRFYLASDPVGSTAEGESLLRRFEVVRVRDRLEFRDQDGSVYVGRVQSGSAAGSTDGATHWAYEGRGSRVGSGQVVQITGQFGPAPEVHEGEDDVMMSSPFSGTAALGDGRVVEVRARPEP